MGEGGWMRPCLESASERSDSLVDCMRAAWFAVGAKRRASTSSDSGAGLGLLPPPAPLCCEC